MTKIEVAINIIGVMSAGISIWQAYSARKDRKEIEKYKDLVKNKIYGQDLVLIYEEALKIKQILLKYGSTSIVSHGRNLDNDNKAILAFISKVKENESLFLDNVSDEYCLEMNKAYINKEYLRMLSMTSDLLNKIKKLKENHLL